MSNRCFIYVLAVLVWLVINITVHAQQVTALYTDSIPNSVGHTSDTPTLTAYLPAKEKANGAGILVIPGGAYSFLAIQEEGYMVAKAFAERGFAAFVLKYRLPDDATMRNKNIGPLQDAQQGIRYIREHAAAYGLRADKVGVIGYSAGGHLASTLGTHFDSSFIPNAAKTNLRPDFMILVYPVISMDNSLTHRGSRVKLLGDGPSMQTVFYFSNEEQVTRNTPPVYLTHTGDDEIVDVQNSIAMYQSLLKYKVPAELHLYPHGNHGFTQRMPVEEWISPMLLFLRKNGIIP